MPSHSMASDAGGNFNLEDEDEDDDDVTPSRRVQSHEAGVSSGAGSVNGHGHHGGPVSMRSLTSNWSLRGQGQMQGQEDR